MPNIGSCQIRCNYGRKFEDHWVPFGPFGWGELHCNPDSFFSDFCDIFPPAPGYHFHEEAIEALNMVISWSGCDENYLFAELTDTESEIRDVYPDTVLKIFKDGNLMRLLAEGCAIFLLVVFSILGAKLDFGDEHHIFGIGKVKQNEEKYLRSIFYVGNQIPTVVIDKIKSLSYFAEKREEIRKQRKPLELLKRTLFEFVIEDQVPKPVDVMHYLRSVIIGPSIEQVDIWVVESSDHQSQTSASELCKLGYKFKPLTQNCGSRRIKCVRGYRGVVVHLPVINVVDGKYLELMMRSIEDFEDAHRGSPDFQPEATSYFSFLSKLVRTADDVDVLYHHGIIQGTELECLPAILNHFYEPPPYNCERLKTKEIKKYRPRLHLFWKYKWLIIGAFVLLNILATLMLQFMQTGYTALGYYKQG